VSSVANREWRWAWRDVEVVGVRDVVSGLFARALVWGLDTGAPDPRREQLGHG